MALCSGLSEQRAAARCSTSSSSCPAVRRVRCSAFSAKTAAQRSAEVGREWLETILSRFGPTTDKAQNIATLDFEKPLLELDKRIKEVRNVAEENGVDVSAQIAELEQRAQQLRKETYSRLTPTQRLQVARHPNRPTCLDIILNITDKFVELHGDRAGLDDPAIVCGIGSMDGVSFMFIGQQKGRNTKVSCETLNCCVVPVPAQAWYRQSQVKPGISVTSAFSECHVRAVQGLKLALIPFIPALVRLLAAFLLLEHCSSW
eukprot:GHRR01007778.1.p1 GENE.GHRR01007778.1~~GHRR01007778.1.p1  ORF type:complete len:260 (+),score=63.25 GHRR01007778.1:111-890(+)